MTAAAPKMPRPAPRDGGNGASTCDPSDRSIFSAPGRATQARRRLTRLDQPLEVAKFWADRSRRTAICVRLATRGDGRNVAMLAAQFVGSDGRMVAGPIITIDVHRLPELAAALQRAHRLAIERRLILDRGGR